MQTGFLKITGKLLVFKFPIKDFTYFTVFFFQFIYLNYRVDFPSRLEVRGCLDLRSFVLRCPEYEHLRKLGLKNLTESILGRTLDKSARVRLSNWEAEELTDAQTEYAADDALVAVDIFR